MRSWAIAVVSVCVVGCGGGGTSKTVGTGASTTATIGPEGGQISLEGAALTIPPGALATSVDIKLTSSTVAVPKFQMAAPLYVFEPDNLQFAKPASITITAPAGLKATTMLLSTVHAGGPGVTWFKDLKGTASGQTITGSLRHFSGVTAADLLPCEEKQEEKDCPTLKCGDHVVLDDERPMDNDLPLSGLLVPVTLPDQCLLHCAPCGTPSEAPIPPDEPAIVDIVGDSASDFSSPSLDDVACDTWSATFLGAPFKLGGDSAANGHSFTWTLTTTTSVIAEDGVPIYQGTIPAGATLNFGYFGIIPTMTMTGLDATKNPGTLTIGGPFECPGSYIPKPMPAGGVGTGGSNGAGGSGAGRSGAAGSSGHAPPTILSVVPTIASPGGLVVLHGTNLGDGMGDDMVTVSGVDASKGIMYNGFGGDVGLVVPDGAANGTVTWTNKWGTGSWSGTLQVNYKPTITSMTPAGPGPGAMVTLTGTHFENLDTTSGLWLQTVQLLMNGATDAQRPLTIVDAQHATAVLPAFAEPPNSMVTDCSGLLWLTDLSAASSGEETSLTFPFTVTGLPDCP
jgi:hypothetical protein